MNSVSYSANFLSGLKEFPSFFGQINYPIYDFKIFILPFVAKKNKSVFFF